MDFIQELKNDKNNLKHTLELIRRNPVFINEEVSELEKELEAIDNILLILGEIEK